MVLDVSGLDYICVAGEMLTGDLAGVLGEMSTGGFYNITTLTRKKCIRK